MIHLQAAPRVVAGRTSRFTRYECDVCNTPKARNEFHTCAAGRYSTCAVCLKEINFVRRRLDQVLMRLKPWEKREPKAPKVPRVRPQAVAALGIGTRWIGGGYPA